MSNNSSTIDIKGKDAILQVFKEAKAGTRNIALAVDGGGIRGVIVAKALEILERELRKPNSIGSQPVLQPDETLNKYIKVIAGTSTGSIIASAIAAGIPADEIHRLYLQFATDIFTFLRRQFATKLANLVAGKPFYQNKCLLDELNSNLSLWFFKGIKKGVIDKYTSLDSHTNQPVLLMEHFWNPEFRKPEIDLIITTMDLKTFKSRFVKPYNTPETANDCDFTKWPVHKAVVASSAIPLYFPMVSCKEKNCDSDFADGGVGAFGNPSYLAAFELSKVLNHEIVEGKWEYKAHKPTIAWGTTKTSLISIGTGIPVSYIKKSGDAEGLNILKWLDVIMNAFSRSTSQQQMDLASLFSPKIDIHRYNVVFEGENIGADDTGRLDDLTKMGEDLGKYILENIQEMDLVTKSRGTGIRAGNR